MYVNMIYTVEKSVSLLFPNIAVCIRKQKLNYVKQTRKAHFTLHTPFNWTFGLNRSHRIYISEHSDDYYTDEMYTKVIICDSNYVNILFCVANPERNREGVVVNK